MKRFSVTATAQGFQIEGFPEAVKFLRVTGPKGQRLADLALHRADLDFAFECLTELNTTPEQSRVLRQALWRSAIVHFVKCFGQSESRFSLNPDKVYREYTAAKEPYRYFESLRNKHLVHDENSYAQCLPGAVLNKEELNPKIAKVLCLSVFGETLNQANYSNLRLLVARAQEWLVAQFDQLAGIVSAEFEQKPYDELFAMDGVTYTAPEVHEIHIPRPPL
jgi:hypothetical protein